MKKWLQYGLSFLLLTLAFLFTGVTAYHSGHDAGRQKGKAEERLWAQLEVKRVQEQLRPLIYDNDPEYDMHFLEDLLRNIQTANISIEYALNEHGYSKGIISFYFAK